MFHADGQTDRHDEANSRFCQFCVSTTGNGPTIPQFPSLLLDH